MARFPRIHQLLRCYLSDDTPMPLHIDDISQDGYTEHVDMPKPAML